MNQTIIEKILSKAASKRVQAGDRVWAELDLVVMRDFGGPNVILEYKERFGNRRVFNPDKVAFTFDLYAPARDEQVAANQAECREFADEQGIKLFDVWNGIGQHVLLENGRVKPWDVIIGTDSHMNLLGSVGAFATGVGTTDIVGGLCSGKLWFRVPPTIKVIINGELGEQVTSKDLILFILKKLGTDGALYHSIEFTGSTVRTLDLAGRITLASMVTEMSGVVGFIPPDKKILQLIHEHSGRTVESVDADPNAIYEQVLEFDITGLEPQIACPHSPDNVKVVKEVQGEPLNQVFIGSCTNGQFADLKLAADVLRSNKVKKDLRLIVTPATKRVAKRIIETGVHEILLNAGAIVTNPSCALCTTGHPGILSPGESMLSTSNRNFPGKLGKGAKVYLSSSLTAAASAITGVITDPREI